MKGSKGMRALCGTILAAAAWSAGADGAYFFNECYREPEEMDVLDG